MEAIIQNAIKILIDHAHSGILLSIWMVVNLKVAMGRNKFVNKIKKIVLFKISGYSFIIVLK